MTAKEYLHQYKRIKARLTAIEAIIRDIREELAGLGASTLRSAWPDGQPHGTGTTDPTGNRAATEADRQNEVQRQKLRERLMDLETRELRARADLWERRMEIEDTIGQVADPIQQDILRRHYVAGETFEWIAVELSYSWRHTVRLHGAALLEVEEILRKKRENGNMS